MSKFDVSFFILDEIAVLAGLKPEPFENTIHV